MTTKTQNYNTETVKIQSDHKQTDSLRLRILFLCMRGGGLSQVPWDPHCPVIRLSFLPQHWSNFSEQLDAHREIRADQS